MSEFNYGKFVKEYIERTQNNLDIINYLKNTEIYEITQLINSLFGTIVLPYEHFKSKLSKRFDGKNMLSNKPGYSQIVRIINNAKNCGRLRCTYFNENNQDFLVRNFLFHIRNALAHSGNGKMYFSEGNKKGIIGEVYFCDVNGDDKQFFCAKFDIDTIRKLKDAVAIMYSSLDEEDDEEKINEKIKAYDDLKNNMNRFLAGECNEFDFGSDD